eukprot:gene32855-48178_t
MPFCFAEARCGGYVLPDAVSYTACWADPAHAGALLTFGGMTDQRRSCGGLWRLRQHAAGGGQ